MEGSKTLSTTRQNEGLVRTAGLIEADIDVAWRVVITSPGSVEIAALSSLANALKRPVAHLAKLAYHAPTVLVHGVAAEQANEISEGCRQLGLEAISEIGDGHIEASPDRFDAAVHIEDPAVLPDAIDTVCRIVGVPADQAYQMLATPPGLLIGGISQASIDALALRFGAGVELRVCRSETGPFDLFVTRDAPTTAELARICGSRRGLVTIGLDHAEAEQAAARLPKGSVHVVARDLVRFDLVLEGVEDGPADTTDTDRAAAWISDNFGVDATRFDAVLRHAPIALTEGLTYDRAEELSAQGGMVGLRLASAAAGFDRYEVSVVKAANLTAVGELAKQMELPIPNRLPALLASDLSDLEARCLAHCFEQVGAALSFDTTQPSFATSPGGGR